MDDLFVERFCFSNPKVAAIISDTIFACAGRLSRDIHPENVIRPEKRKISGTCFLLPEQLRLDMPAYPSGLPFEKI